MDKIHYSLMGFICYMMMRSTLGWSSNFFRVKRSIKLQKLMEAFCKKRSLDPKSMQFTFDGVGLEKNKTPEELGMEDGDEIDALELVDGA
ncbi:small ubiquitin-like modifier 1 [Prunus dulcis]|uniref:Small ubiquitin-like modifier 1 n=1 Tax=Prunus dulcis TaxID=3755 RepID=A0A4Y1QKJ6_PRUDU|nr:small ubiquitin-like modifier 1 [Prunus dulcis]